MQKDAALRQYWVRAHRNLEEGKNEQSGWHDGGCFKKHESQDVLAKRKADAAKTTLPPLAEKSSKLLKVNENLVRRKTEAAKVAAAEREKKRIHDPSPMTNLENTT
jgi:hypothetical protein